MNVNSGNGEFQPADPTRRRQVQIALAAACVLGIAALAGLYFWLRSIGTSLDPANAHHYNTVTLKVLGALALCSGLVAGAVGTWMLRTATETRAQRRWPPAGMRTTSDVRIRYLTAADAVASELRTGAFAVVIFATSATGWGIWRILTADA